MGSETRRRTSSAPGRSADVAVVGGGAVGVAAAHALAARGASVVLLERGPDVAAACSAGNAGIVGAGHVLPLAGPEALRDGVRWLRRPDSPFALRPRAAVVPWLVRFVAASRPAAVERSRSILRPLALESAQLHADLAASGLDTGFRRRGLLEVYAGRRAFAAAAGAVERDRDDGLRARVLDAAQVAAAWPQIGGAVAGAILHEDEAHCDPERFVHALADEARVHGATIRTGVEVLELRRGPAGGVTSLRTTAGEVRAGEIVLAAGAWSAQLAATARLRLPLEGGKGYHAELPAAAGDLEVPVWFHEHRVVVTPTPGRIRLAGTLELAGVDERVDPLRVDAVVRAGSAGIRGLAERPVRRIWRGLRPCTPDGVPIIGRAPSVPNLVLATGHGMWGLQLAPVTGRLVADLLGAGAAAPALGPERFAAA